jgi:hypothetical protein
LLAVFQLCTMPNHSLAVRRWESDKASSGFNGSSMMMMMMSAPRPVSTPPTEVASRQPGWQQMPVEVAGDDAPTIAQELVGEILAPGLR